MIYPKPYSIYLRRITGFWSFSGLGGDPVSKTIKIRTPLRKPKMIVGISKRNIRTKVYSCYIPAVFLGSPASPFWSVWFPCPYAESFPFHVSLQTYWIPTSK